MAQIHGDAARFPQALAKRHLVRESTFLIVVAMGTGVLLGGAFVAMFSRTWWLTFGSVAVAFVIVRRWEKVFDRYTRDDRNERRNALRGADAESVVALALSELPNDFHVYNGVQLDGSSDVDHVVIGASGVWLVSTKSAQGFFSIDGPDQRLNGQASYFSQDAVRDALRLKDKLGTDYAGRLFVQPITALPFAFIDGDGIRLPQPVVNPKELLDLIDARRPRETRTTKEIAQLVRAMDGLTMRRSKAMAEA